MKKLMMAVLALGMITGFGCTANQRVRSFGGVSTEKLPAGTKLVNMTWKDRNLWILTRPMRSNEVAETYEFAESSNFGVIQGRVIVVERK